MKSLLPFFLGLLAAPALAAPPNLVLILADDLGWADVGCYGSEIQTPHLDALAAGGVRFTQFYNCARCCPTRASLLTGLYPHQAGVGSMSNDQGPEQPGYRGTIQPNCVTLAEALRPAGYRTYMVGKWHLHNAQDIKPTDRGFDEFYGMLGGYNSCWEEHPSYTRWPQGRTPRIYTSAAQGAPGTFYATEAFGDYALDFMADARAAQHPFFLYLAFNAPHFPLHAYAADIAKYEALYFTKGWDVLRDERLAKQKRLGLIPADLPLPPRSIVPAKSHAQPSPYAGRENPAWDSLPEDRRRDLARRMAVYAAMVDRLDANVGRVVADLKAHQELDNTLIIFLSDNGACWEWDPYGFDVSSSPQNILHTGADLAKQGQPGDYMSYGSGWANAGNTPWRLYKHFSHEGGIRTPCIMHWPAGIKAAGELRPQVGHVIDLMPTLCAVAGATYPTTRQGTNVQPMEGLNLLPALKNEAPQRTQSLFFEHEKSRAVRDGKWKLVSLQDDAWELYDLDADPNELHDLMTTAPDQAHTLVEKWEAWADRCHVERPRLETPQIAGHPLTIECDVTTTATSGVILAHGGQRYGYALHLADGHVIFTVRNDSQPTAIQSMKTVKGIFHLTAKLAADGTMALSVDAVPRATGKAPGVITQQPQDGLTIGQDTLSAVGDYPVPSILQGTVSHVRITAE